MLSNELHVDEEKRFNTDQAEVRSVDLLTLLRCVVHLSG